MAVSFAIARRQSPEVRRVFALLREVGPLRATPKGFWRATPTSYKSKKSVLIKTIVSAWLLRHRNVIILLLLLSREYLKNVVLRGIQLQRFVRPACGTHSMSRMLFRKRRVHEDDPSAYLDSNPARRSQRSGRGVHFCRGGIRFAAPRRALWHRNSCMLFTL